MSSEGKVALIIGGGRHSGAECTRQLAQGGASFALHYNSGKSKDQTLRFQDELLRAGVKVSVHAGDLSTAAAVERLFAEVLAEHKKIDIVVNNAGMVLEKPVTQISEDQYDEMFAYAVFVDEQRRKWVDRYTESVQKQCSST